MQKNPYLTFLYNNDTFRSFSCADFKFSPLPFLNFISYDFRTYFQSALCFLSFSLQPPNNTALHLIKILSNLPSTIGQFNQITGNIYNYLIDSFEISPHVNKSVYLINLPQYPRTARYTRTICSLYHTQPDRTENKKL